MTTKKKIPIQKFQVTTKKKIPLQKFQVTTKKKIPVRMFQVTTKKKIAGRKPGARTRSSSSMEGSQGRRSNVKGAVRMGRVSRTRLRI